MDKFDLKTMLEEIKNDGKTTSKMDPRLSRAGLKKLVAEKRNARKNNANK